MSKFSHDIDDDEIRIISHVDSKDGLAKDNSGRSRKRVVALVVICAILLLAGIIFYLCWFTSAAPSDGENYSMSEPLPASEEVDSNSKSDVACAVSEAAKAYTAISDTTVGGTRFTILNPVNATPRLYVGNEILNDSCVVLVAQAADVRRDNGGIVGAYVLNGELLGKGQSKSGYCAIIDGRLTIGVAQSTPLLEQALETDGYFFRQYPLVVANQIVENKPAGKALRKALAEINGTIVVILSQERMTFDRFSRCLLDMGVSNAIYLVGSTAYGFARDSDGNKIEFGTYNNNPGANVNYIYWK